MTANNGRYPKLRPLDVKPVTHDGQQYILLRDPLQLSDKILLVPRELAPALALCDGTTEDSEAISAALAVRFGIRIPAGVVAPMLQALDEALLLENDRVAQARAQALEDYRQAPARKPAIAGVSYPEDPDELRALLQGFVDNISGGAGTGNGPRVGPTAGRGLVSPHIDYERGGPVYAQVWSRAGEMARDADLAIIFGTDHYGSLGRITLTRQHYATPFGILPTARDVVDQLAEAVMADLAYEEELHHASEHSIELAAVWLHFIRGGVPCDVVPILCGSFAGFIAGQSDADADPSICGLIDVLKEATRGRRVLVVAAADLAHIGPAFGQGPVDMVGRALVKGADDELIGRMCAGDAAGFLAAIERVQDSNNVCGVSPIYMALKMLAGAKGEPAGYDRCPADDDNTSLVSICGVVFE